MPVLWPPSAPLIASYTAPIPLRQYAIYYDLYEEVLVPGDIDGMLSTDENASRSVFDTYDDASMDGEDLVLDHNAYAYNPAIWYKTTPALEAWDTWNGYAHYWLITPGAGCSQYLGIDEDSSIGIGDPGIVQAASGAAGYWGFWIGGTEIIRFTDGTVVGLMIVRRYDSNGYYYLYRTTGDWILFWMDEGPLKTA